MATAWETEDELSSAAAASLPTPADTPYRTPSRSSLGKKSRRRSATPPNDINSSSPPSLPRDKVPDRSSKRASKDMIADEPISVLDPRRFTPTLHANLVSEILALRRDQEEKLKIIESLETSLHESKEEQESAQDGHLATAKENRSLKRQLALLEGGTSSALGELARERDEAVDAISEAKRRLDSAQKKLRTQEEDSQRVHDLWAKEKDDWEEERRKYERKVHVAESRLKVVLDEVAQLQSAELDGAQHHAVAESDGEDLAKGGHDNRSVRSMSMTNSIRFSTISAAGALKMNGHSLADELNFDDDEDEDGFQTDPEGGRQSVLSNPRHMRNQSRDSVFSRTHRRNFSIESGGQRPGSVARAKAFANPTVLEELELASDGVGASNGVHVDYTDTGVQYSPPPSPQLGPSKPSTPETPVRAKGRKTPGVLDACSPPRDEWEIEANQSRKRVPVSKLMVSSEAQTMGEPLSPPRTPIDLVEPEPEPEPVRPATKSSGTQTETPQPPEPPRSSSPRLVPSISIVPPTSRPATPREHRLPEYVKDFGCQVSLLTSRPTMSTSIQTDEIRIDQRLDKLPPHLHPSAISSRPNSPNVVATTEEGKNFTPVPGHLPPRNPRRLAAKRSFTSDVGSSPPVSPTVDAFETRDAYPGNNDDGPLSSSKAPIRRPHRFSSLFAGFEDGSSDDGNDLTEADGSDAEYRTALSAPRHQSGSRQGHHKSAASSTVTSPERKSKPQKQAPSVMKQIGGTETYSSFALPDGRDNLTRNPSLKVSTRLGDKAEPGNGKPGAIRRSAMIQSGIATHQGRARSPSLPDARDPPFPIPTRASSRRPPFSASAPSDASHSPTRRMEPRHRRGLRGSGTVYRNNSVRKVRSAAALPRNPRYYRRQGSRSPPPMSPSDPPESPGLPPLPHNDITTPRSRDRHGAPRYRSHRSQPSTNTAVTDNTNVGSVNSGQQASGVVDAIAQTMVGEWMFKYVRRRKSFGVANDTGGKVDESSNDRHKRWVWLAPYERAILWSSKQPSSGSALMGKSGRKLTIQSVLDVKDDNPPPKGISTIFNRSILILTPQRALKFTATNPDRHYIWLTSLSFLAHSQQAIPEILHPSSAAAPPPSAHKSHAADFALEVPPQTNAKSKRIRDSIRLTKGKNPALMRPDSNMGSNINASQLEEVLAVPSVHRAMLTQNHNRELSREAAEPPFIPRFAERTQERVHERANQVVLHGRKRSNTGGHIPPPLSFRGFSGPAGSGTGTSSYHTATNSTAANSVGTAGSSDIYQSQGSTGYFPGSNSAYNAASSWGGSQRTSEASSRPGPNFFEAIGTVRMEAFIQPLTFPRFDDDPNELAEVEDEDSIAGPKQWRHRARKRSKDIRRQRSRSRRRDSYNSRGTRATADSSCYGGSSRATGEDDMFFYREDPFKGF